VTSSLGISREKLVWMGILIGTDFNPKGVKGLGPKRSLKTVKKHESFEDVMDDSKVEWTHDNSAYKIRDFFMNPPTKKTDLGSGELNRSKVKEILVDRHEFSEDRVSSNLDDLENGLNSRQPGLGSFT
jgi:flap endonuclease-1